MGSASHTELPTSFTSYAQDASASLALTALLVTYACASQAPYSSQGDKQASDGTQVRGGKPAHDNAMDDRPTVELASSAQSDASNVLVGAALPEYWRRAKPDAQGLTVLLVSNAADVSDVQASAESQVSYAEDTEDTADKEGMADNKGDDGASSTDNRPNTIHTHGTAHKQSY
ncbi:Uncharacterised protein [BD1-7 clade bacterium]|uniref:Uncharacterized protein n=1 Tax=BD1-7 clade bacterium TaxID=2029982 RepID=A0A5S9PN32_9GAMM|nr:Uncharacterised protein [BD1-7 clade bacterium]